MSAMAAGSAERPAEVEALIRNQPLQECRPYLQAVICDLGAPVDVGQSSEASGKGLFAARVRPCLPCMAQPADLWAAQLPAAGLQALQRRLGVRGRLLRRTS